MKTGDKVKVVYQCGIEEIQTISEISSPIDPFKSRVFYFSDGIGKWAFEFMCENLNITQQRISASPSGH